MKQWQKIRELLALNNIEVKQDDDLNIQLMIINKSDKSIGIFEGKGFSLAIGKAYTHMKKYNKKNKCYN